MTGRSWFIRQSGAFFIIFISYGFGLLSVAPGFPNLWPQPLPFRQHGSDVKKSHDGRCKEESTPVSVLLAVKKAPSTLSAVSRRTLAGLRAPRDRWREVHKAPADAVLLLSCSQLYRREREDRDRLGLQKQNVPVLPISAQKSSEAAQEPCSPF